MTTILITGANRGIGPSDNMRMRARKFTPAAEIRTSRTI